MEDIDLPFAVEQEYNKELFASYQKNTVTKLSKVYKAVRTIFAIITILTAIFTAVIFFPYYSVYFLFVCVCVGGYMILMLFQHILS